MGIRFYCRHCQKSLNVKNSQAGQHGDCPYCHKSIIVPQESTHADSVGSDSVGSESIGSSGSSASALADAANQEDVTIDTPLPGFDLDQHIDDAGLGGSSIRLENENALDGFSVPFAPSSSPNPKINSVQKTKEPDNSFLLDKPLPPSTLGKIDPIAEEPKKVWYFRSKKLGEKGPLKAKLMQEHLDKGDVTIGCIVWREDWEDWQPAERVFPPLVALAEQNEAKRMMADAAYKIPDELNPHSALQRRKRKMRVLGIVAIAAGLLTIGGLVYLLTNLVSK